MVTPDIHDHVLHRHSILTKNITQIETFLRYPDKLKGFYNLGRF